MKTTAIEKYLKKHLSTCTMHRYSDGDNRKCSCGLDEARAELGAILTELAKVYDVLADKRDENNQLNTQFAAKDAALEALFQACANLPVEYMDKMEKEINAASKALKGLK